MHSAFINFSVAKESYTPPPLVVTNTNELLYRFFKGETRLIKHLVESNGFSSTESHNWNLIWLISPGPGYLY